MVEIGSTGLTKYEEGGPSLAATGLHLAPASFKQLSLWSLLALLLDSFRPSTTRTYEAIHNMHFFFILHLDSRTFKELGVCANYVP